MKNFIASLLTLILLTSCNKGQKSIKPVVSDVSESIYASGIIKSKNQYEAFSTVNGIVDTLFVTEGSQVRVGTPLLFISSDVPRLSEENARLAADYADLNSNQGKLKDAQLSLEMARKKMNNDSLMYVRQKNLWKQQIGSKVEFEQRELGYQNSKDSYLAALARYGDLKNQLNYNAAQSKKNLSISKHIAGDYLVKSRVNGTVYQINVEKGEMVGMQAPLAVIGDANNFILEMEVDEYDILKVRKDLPVQVSLDSYKGTSFEARVTKINPIMDSRSRTFIVEAEFVNAPKILYPNISFEANIVLATKRNALLIPRNCVINDSLVVKANGDTVRVKTGLRDYKKIEVLSGITAKDELILPQK